jgi:hypothetical protein
LRTSVALNEFRNVIDTSSRHGAGFNFTVAD